MAVKEEYFLTDFPNNNVFVDSLITEIDLDTTIVIPLSHVDVDEAAARVDIWFDSALSAAEKTALDSIVASHNDSPTAPVNFIIYVRTTGDDDAGTGAIQNPYRTVLRALEDVPRMIPDNVIYVIDATGIGTETVDAPIKLTGYAGGRRDFTNTPTILGGMTARGLNIVAGFTDIDTITAGEITSETQDPVTGLNTLNTNKSLTADQYKGKILFADNGFAPVPAAGNTAGPNSDVELCTDFTFLAAPWRVTEPSAAIHSTSGPALQVESSDTIAIRGFEFSSDTDRSVLFFNRVVAEVRGCVFNGFKAGNLCLMSLVGCVVLGSEKFLVDSGSSLLADQLYSDMAGADIVFREFSRAGSDGFIARAIFENAGSAIGSGGNQLIGSFSSKIEAVAIRNSSSDGIFVPEGGRAELVSVSIENCAGDGLHVQGGMAVMDTVGGAGNGGFGALMEDGARVLRKGLPTVTGTSGDLRLGANGATTWGSLGASNTDLAAVAPEIVRIHT